MSRVRGIRQRAVTGLLIAVMSTVAALLMIGVVGCSKDNQASNDQSFSTVQEGKLTIVSDLAFPPFEYMDGDTPAGFGVELMNAICDEAGLEPNWLPPQKFDTIVPMVSQGTQADVAMSSVTITEARKNDVLFTDAYLDSNQGLAVLDSSSFASEDDLVAAGNITVGVQSGTSGEAWAEENLPQATIVPLDDPIAAFTALQAGKVDVVSCDLPVQQWLIKSSYESCKIIAEIPTGEQYGIPVSKSNPKLQEKLNDALQAVRDNGTYDELYEKYFGLS